MAMATSRLAIGVVFLVGCAAGGVASQLATPAARADAGGPEWEYLCFTPSSHEDTATKEFSDGGRDGWELVGFRGDDYACMKRTSR